MKVKVRRILLTYVSAVAVTLVGASVWFDTSHVSASECVDQEAEDYPHLERVAQEVVGELSDRVQRYSFCEDAGIPGAVVYVSVYDWSSRSQAREFLDGVSYAHPSSSPGDFLARGVVIQSIQTTDYLENDGHTYVTLAFRAPK